MSVNAEKQALWRVLNSVAGLLILLLVGASSWTVTNVIAMQSKMAEMRADSFCKNDGLNVWKEIGAIRKEIAEIPKDTPPKWLLDRLDRMDSRLKSIEDKVSDIRKQERTSYEDDAVDSVVRVPCVGVREDVYTNGTDIVGGGSKR